MSIWIVTTGNSDVILKHDKTWGKLHDEADIERSPSPKAIPINPYDKAEGYTVSGLSRALGCAAWIVDALLGTGSRGEPRPPLDAAIDRLNAAAAPKLAVICPADWTARAASRPHTPSAPPTRAPSSPSRPAFSTPRRPPIFFAGPARVRHRRAAEARRASDD